MMLQTGMMMLAPEQAYTPFEFHASSEVNKAIFELVQLLLIAFAGMDMDTILEMVPAFLYTLMEKLQCPHIDYDHRCIEWYLRCSCQGPNFLPWSMDLPLSKNGM